MLISIAEPAGANLAMQRRIAEAMRLAERRKRRIEFSGSPHRLMVQTGQHRKPRNGTLPGSARRALQRRLAGG